MLKKLMCFCLVFFLSACNQEMSYDYLIHHLDILKSKVQQCETLSSVNESEARQQGCDIVFNAANNVISLSNRLQNDPQEFGKYVLNLEIKYVQSQKAFQLAQQNYTELQKKNISDVEKQRAQKQLSEAKNLFQRKEEEVKLALAVLGLSSPE